MCVAVVCMCVCVHVLMCLCLCVRVCAFVEPVKLVVSVKWWAGCIAVWLCSTGAWEMWVHVIT